MFFLVVYYTTHGIMSFLFEKIKIYCRHTHDPHPHFVLFQSSPGLL